VVDEKIAKGSHAKIFNARWSTVYKPMTMHYSLFRSFLKGRYHNFLIFFSNF
jgi:hypothetical protein